MRIPAIRDSTGLENQLGDLQAGKPAAICRHGDDAGLALFHDNKVTVAHIGDSRLYRLRGENFAADEGSFAAAGADRRRHDQRRGCPSLAEQEPGHPCAGVDPEVETEIHDYDVLPGDIYLPVPTVSTTWSRTRKSP